jgi:type IV pilus assembly protein PilO
MTRRTVLIAFGAAALLLVMWFLLLWGPQGGRLSDANDRQVAAETQNSTLELRLARLRAAQERAPELMADLEELRRAVPDEPDLAQFILDANDAASEAGVEFLSIAPGVPEQSDSLLPPTIALNISVTGGYFEVIDYLDRLSDLPRIVVVDDLTLTPSEGETGLELSVSLTARMFATAAPQVTPPTTVAPPVDAATGEPAPTTPEITVSP